VIDYEYIDLQIAGAFLYLICIKKGAARFDVYFFYFPEKKLKTAFSHLFSYSLKKLYALFRCIALYVFSIIDNK